MNDQIKDFVGKHREEFDHLEAPAFDMQRFKKSGLQASTPEIKTIPFYKNRKWLVAASLIIAIGTVWLFLIKDEKSKNIPYAATKTSPKHKNVIKDKPLDKIDTTKMVENSEQPIVFAQAKAPEKALPKINKAMQTDYEALQDSSSASIRLLAILEIEKSEKINNKMLDMLSQTLNKDGNTNVRLAALSLLQKYASDQHASSLLVNSLGKQDDPIVQLGLISLLGKMKNVKIDDKLYAIVDNPQTFAAVRDEAYNVLLNQDKL